MNPGKKFARAPDQRHHGRVRIPFDARHPPVRGESPAAPSERLKPVSDCSIQMAAPAAAPIRRLPWRRSRWRSSNGGRSTRGATAV
jgi:hypothetical protein